MNHRDPADAWRLPRIRALLAGLPGPTGNGELLAQVDVGDADSMPGAAFALLDRVARLPPRPPPGGFEENVPADAGEFMAKLPETAEATATGVLVWLMSTTMVYGGHGRYAEAKARDVAKAGQFRAIGSGIAVSAERTWSGNAFARLPGVRFTDRYATGASYAR